MWSQMNRYYWCPLSLGGAKLAKWSYTWSTGSLLRVRSPFHVVFNIYCTSVTKYRTHDTYIIFEDTLFFKDLQYVNALGIIERHLNQNLAHIYSTPFIATPWLSLSSKECSQICHPWQWWSRKLRNNVSWKQKSMSYFLYDIWRH